MRHHFYRCGHLRVLSVDASDLSGDRKGGGPILEELCDARWLSPCVGLVDCDVLALGQKRRLLAQRATREPEDAEAASLFADGDTVRARELDQLRLELQEERAQIVDENRRIAAELAAALDARAEAGLSEQSELARGGISIRLDDELRAFRSARLDAIDSAVEAIGRGGYGECLRCAAPIDLERLRTSPETRVCAKCAEPAK